MPNSGTGAPEAAGAGSSVDLDLPLLDFLVAEWMLLEGVVSPAWLPLSPVHLDEKTVEALEAVRVVGAALDEGNFKGALSAFEGALDTMRSERRELGDVGEDGDNIGDEVTFRLEEQLFIHLVRRGDMEEALEQLERLAQLGARLIDGVAKKMADDFFENFKQLVGAEAESTSGTPD